MEITQSRICLVVKEIFTLLGGNDKKSQSVVHRHPVSDAAGERWAGTEGQTADWWEVAEIRGRGRRVESGELARQKWKLRRSAGDAGHGQLLPGSVAAAFCKTSCGSRELLL